VQFISPSTGFTVAGGSDNTDHCYGPEIPQVAGVALTTSDGGRSSRSSVPRQELLHVGQGVVVIGRGKQVQPP
jgi:hypothetical protein